ncbi:hypothetical protein VUR80DRAFT_1482 [Thermomyces stellatus]
MVSSAPPKQRGVGPQPQQAAEGRRDRHWHGGNPPTTLNRPVPGLRALTVAYRDPPPPAVAKSARILLASRSTCNTAGSAPSSAKWETAVR